MKKIYYLSTCSTCKKIMTDLNINKANGFELQDIKTQKISKEQLQEMARLAGSYEALFSRRALKYKELKLKEHALTEKDYQAYILEEYTFLKRPVIIHQDNIYIGTDKKNLELLSQALS
ncbi:MAG: hypothetical protein E6Q95_02955 [Chitinophagaceae bacterium]|nr:MAG: hypothetical protein E6Q95_02955 [Chitinophagaceae bacterium]